MGDIRSVAGHQALHRFFVAPEAVHDQHVDLTATQQHQMRIVLRLPPGATVVVCDGSGTVYLVKLPSLTGEPGEIVETRVGRPEPTCRVHLYQSGLRGDAFTWLLQKGTEVGVSSFTPVLFARTQSADYRGRTERFRSIVREAAEQCERARLPIVEMPRSFHDAVTIEDHNDRRLRVLLDERETRRRFRSAVEPGVDEVSIFVGPEGGLTEAERALGELHGLMPVSLGRRIMRSETAGLAAAIMALARSGDLG